MTLPSPLRRAFAAVGVAGSLFALAAAPAAAEINPADCDAALLEANAFHRANEPQRLSFLRLVTRENFDRVKAAAGGQLAAGGATIAASPGFDEFSERRQKEFGTTRFSIDADHARNYLATSLPSRALQPYIACLRARPGFSAWIDPDETTRHSATIRVVFRAQGYEGARRLRITFHGTAPDEPIDEHTSLVDGQERFFIVRRAYDEEFGAELYVDRAFAIHLRIPEAPRIRR